MKSTEFFLWLITDERTGKRRRTRHRMTREYALAEYPGAEPDPSTREIRDLPESPEEHHLTGSWLRKG